MLQSRSGRSTSGERFLAFVFYYGEQERETEGSQMPMEIGVSCENQLRIARLPNSCGM
jgi:hypothetical protein